MGDVFLSDKRDPVIGVDRNFWIATILLALIAIAAVVAVYVVPMSSWMPPVAAAPAGKIDELLQFMLAIGAALFVAVAGYLVYFSIAFRARKSDPPNAIGIQAHDNKTLEFWWAVIPIILVVVLSIASIRIWYNIEIQPNNGMVVEAIGHQWYFTFRYPQVNGEITDAMHLPAGMPVTLNVTSTDVIHSFWVPAFRLKADMVPGLINTIRFTPTIPGTYQIICTEFCGTQHSTMDKQTVVVESAANFRAWYNGVQQKNAHLSNALPRVSTEAIALGGGNATAGKALFAQKCSACHAVGAFNDRIVGPGLKGVLHDPTHPNLVDGDKATPADIAKILQSGYTGSIGHMPNAAQNGLSDSDIANLVAYLNTLK